MEKKKFAVFFDDKFWWLIQGIDSSISSQARFNLASTLGGTQNSEPFVRVALVRILLHHQSHRVPRTHYVYWIYPKSNN